MKTNSLLSVLLISLLLILFSGCPTNNPDPDLNPNGNNPSGTTPLNTKKIKAYLGYPLYLHASVDKPLKGWHWHKNGVSDSTKNEIVYEITSFDSTDIGVYESHLDTTPHIVIDRFEIEAQKISKDTLGTEYIYHEFVIKFKPNVPNLRKDSIRNALGATLLETCMCDSDLELWLVDSLGIGVENKNDEITSSIDIEGSDPNYLVKHNTEFVSDPSEFSLPENKNSTNKVLVAIIDTGIDTDHNEFVGKIWKNPGESGLQIGIDNDSNCLVDDINGYDFVNNDGNSKEKALWHGTHVAGLVNRFSQGHAEIMNLKAFGHQPLSTLFNVLCATEYAFSKDAKIINYSFGWSQTPSILLQSTMEQKGKSCGVLFVCSAGNDGRSNLNTPHFPSGYNVVNARLNTNFKFKKLNNVVEVSSFKELNDAGAIFTDMADYANWSPNVDIVVQGNLPSAMPYGKYAFKKGTSMSAGAISGVLANYLANGNSLDWDDIFECLRINSTTSISGNSAIRYKGDLNQGSFINPSSNCRNINVGNCPSTRGPRLRTANASGGRVLVNPIEVE